MQITKLKSIFFNIKSSSLLIGIEENKLSSVGTFGTS